MPAFGDHPPLPDSLESILSDETTSTVFLKADCPPRAKRGHISELRLETIDDNPWSKIEVSDLSDELATVVDQHPDRSDCFVERERDVESFR